LNFELQSASALTLSIQHPTSNIQHSTFNIQHSTFNIRWYTCTPVAFGGAADFFARDSGLLCRGFQALGLESRAVMPGARQPDDVADLMRTDFANLESAEWWRSHGLDGVVLYAWGRPKFRKVAAAIHQAGIFLVLNQDNGGLVSPLAGFSKWLREQWILAGQGRSVSAWLHFYQLALRGMSIGLCLTDPLRAAHLKQGDVLACVSPQAAEHYRKMCRFYGGADLANRVALVPHPVQALFGFSSGSKRRQVACVARWQDVVQKRPWLLMEVVGLLVAADFGVSVVIAGQATPALEAWHRALPASQRQRVQIRGRVERDELAGILRDSQVFFSPSAYESFGIAAAEALCSGCSVVAGHSDSLASFAWFVGEDSGTLAAVDDAAGHLLALQNELAAWQRGQRNAQRISQVWCERLHADRVAATVLAMNHGASR
jgi:glycosyltransferase involved in cell wall biosynthesis